MKNICKTIFLYKFKENDEEIRKLDEKRFRKLCFEYLVNLDLKVSIVDHLIGFDLIRFEF